MANDGMVKDEPKPKRCNSCTADIDDLPELVLALSVGPAGGDALHEAELREHGMCVQCLLASVAKRVRHAYKLAAGA